MLAMGSLHGAVAMFKARNHVAGCCIHEKVLRAPSYLIAVLIIIAGTTAGVLGLCQNLIESAVLTCAGKLQAGSTCNESNASIELLLCYHGG